MNKKMMIVALCVMISVLGNSSAMAATDKNNSKKVTQAKATPKPKSNKSDVSKKTIIAVKSKQFNEKDIHWKVDRLKETINNQSMNTTIKTPFNRENQIHGIVYGERIDEQGKRYHYWEHEYQNGVLQKTKNVSELISNQSGLRYEKIETNLYNSEGNISSSFINYYNDGKLISSNQIK